MATSRGSDRCWGATPISSDPVRASRTGRHCCIMSQRMEWKASGRRRHQTLWRSPTCCSGPVRNPTRLPICMAGKYTTMSMLVSSTPPAEAGLQIPLVKKLAEYGASVEPLGTVLWGAPLITALAFGFSETAEALVRLGATANTLPAAAGLGRVEQTRDLLPGASPEERHRAFAFAAQHGRTEVVRLLLDAGEDPNRYNPEGAHAHSVPLHQAVWAGHEDTVRLLVERGAWLDIRDKVYNGDAVGLGGYIVGARR